MKPLLILLALVLNCDAAEKTNKEKCIREPSNVLMAECFERHLISSNDLSTKQKRFACLAKHSNVDVLACLDFFKLNHNTLEPKTAKDPGPYTSSAFNSCKNEKTVSLQDKCFDKYFIPRPNRSITGGF